jgi:hypothetical protein
MLALGPGQEFQFPQAGAEEASVAPQAAANSTVALSRVLPRATRLPSRDNSQRYSAPSRECEVWTRRVRSGTVASTCQCTPLPSRASSGSGRAGEEPAG